MAKQIWLKARFGLNSKAFDSGIKNVTASLGRFKSTALNVGRVTGRALVPLTASIHKTTAAIRGLNAVIKSNPLLAAAGAALSVTAFGAIVKGAAESQIQLGRLSNILGVNSKKLAGLKHGAELNGMEFSELTDSIKTFRSSMGKAIRAMVDSACDASGIESLEVPDRG